MVICTLYVHITMANIFGKRSCTLGHIKVCIVILTDIILYSLPLFLCQTVYTARNLQPKKTGGNIYSVIISIQFFKS